MNAPLLFLAVDVAAVVCAALLAVRLLIGCPRNPTAQLIALIALCNACYVILARDEYGPWMPEAFRIDVGGWRAALNLARNMTPGLFMLASWSRFAEHRRPPAVLLVLFGVQLLLEATPAGARDLAKLAAAAMEIGFAGAAIWWALANWQADLVESRRRLRLIIVVVVGLDIIVLSLLLRVLIPGDSRAHYLTHEAFVAVNAGILAFLLLRFSGDQLSAYLSRELVPPPRSAQTGASNPQDQAALGRLKALFDEQHLHREPGLSLALMAQRVGLPEYRLRRLIHDQLGYRNFNLFLHEMRIRDACVQLRDPAQRRTPILTIALSVGYQSINTFNRGFGEIMGQTPSAWRAQVDLEAEKAASQTG